MKTILKLSIIAASSLVATASAFAADLNKGAKKPSYSAPAVKSVNPWDFAFDIGPAIYGIYGTSSCIKCASGTKMAFVHAGISAQATASYWVNDWVAPTLGARGFTSFKGLGATADFGSNDEAFLGGDTLGGRTKSSRMSAFGMVAGVKLGSRSLNIMPYAFLDFANVNAKINIDRASFGNIDPFAAKVSINTPIYGVGARAQWNFTDMLGVSLDGWVGQASKKTWKFSDSEGSIKAATKTPVALGARLGLVAKF